LATNIAESSITIPSVLYVVDFCLLKEINCNGKSGIEILDLTWASKASLR
jgi:HrpA-like RNA helicase